MPDFVITLLLNPVTLAAAVAALVISILLIVLKWKTLSAVQKAVAVTVFACIVLYVVFVCWVVFGFGNPPSPANPTPIA